MIQSHEDVGLAGLHSAFDPILVLGFFDDRSLFGDCLSLPFEDYDTVTTSKMPPTPKPFAGHADAQVFVDAALADVFDESFGFFNLELDIVCSPAFATLEEAPEFPAPLDLSYKASAPLHEDFDIREPLQKKKKTPKTSSQRQREEIASLRSTAARLEQELQRIKTTSRQAPSPSVKEECEGEDDSTYSMLASLWEAVAKRQEAEKLRAEQENVHLKQQLKANVAIAKSLERSLRKRKIKEL